MAQANEQHLTLVVVTHNCVPFLKEFINSWANTVAQCSTLHDHPPQIIAVDSGSTDDTILHLRRLAPHAHLISLGNVGYGTAANAGLAASTTPWTLLCNPDLSFPPNFATHLLAPIINNSPLASAAVIAPKLLNEDNTPQPSVGTFPSITQLLRDQFRPRPQRKYVTHPPTTSSPVDWVSGACLLLHTATLKNLGCFDEKYFLYVEEVDLLYRLHQAGKQTWYHPDASVRHLHPNANRPPRLQVQTYAARGLLRFFAQHGSPGQLFAYRLLATLSRRLPFSEAWMGRNKIIEKSTGP